MRFLLAVLLGAVLGAILLVGLVFVLAGAGVTRSLDREQRPASVTDRQVRRVGIGATQQDVEERLGDSVVADELENARLEEVEPQRTNCIYYDRRGGGPVDLFQLCFLDGELDSKRTL